MHVLQIREFYGCYPSSRIDQHCVYWSSFPHLLKWSRKEAIPGTSDCHDFIARSDKEIQTAYAWLVLRRNEGFLKFKFPQSPDQRESMPHVTGGFISWWEPKLKRSHRIYKVKDWLESLSSSQLWKSSKPASTFHAMLQDEHQVSVVLFFSYSWWLHHLIIDTVQTPQSIHLIPGIVQYMASLEHSTNSGHSAIEYTSFMPNTVHCISLLSFSPHKVKSISEPHSNW